jgi:hypothetical protein
MEDVMTYRCAVALGFSCTLLLTGCANEVSQAMTSNGPASFEAVTADQWQRLSDARIFLGHQSVGGNIIAGVREVLASNPQIPLRVLQTTDPSQMQGPGLYHARIGKNGEPASKLAAFQNVVSDGFGNSTTAMLKFCYVDVTSTTDPQALFEEYRRTIAALRESQPNLTIVHVTLPLRTDIGTLRYVAAVARGKRTGRDVNLIRHRYNELIRKTYGGKEPIFDLAALEATSANGGTTAVRYKGTRLPVLAKEWTYDGGHLNEEGRRHVAKAFLATLADVYSRAESTP